MNILGISAFYHDSAACLVRDGRIVAAAQEERFTRKKHDERFPSNAVRSCLEIGGIGASDLDYVAFYDKPLLKFERILETWIGMAPRGFRMFAKGLPVWLKHKLHTPRAIDRGLGGAYRNRYVFTEHHESHAASAFFPSPFEDAAVVTLDGVGEWATGSIGHGRGNRLDLLQETRFPHSLGLLYSAFTYFCGFQVNSGEYKLMGLAPYGEPVYADRVRSLMDLREDGSFRLDLSYFGYLHTDRMITPKFERLFDGPPRPPESPVTRREMDIAASIQQVTEEVMLRTVRHAHRITGSKNLVMAGGVALNCVGNGRIAREGPFERMWIQPAAGDAGGALGAALFVWHQLLGNARRVEGADAQRASLLGPSYDSTRVRSFLDSAGARYHHLPEEDALLGRVADLLAGERVVGHFAGPMEFGPRALGNRSILGDARSREMQSVMNLKIKFRESFRPFAPIVMRDHAAEYFDMRADLESPYMLIVAPVREGKRVAANGTAAGGIERVKEVRSVVPAVTHVDYSARIQTVDPERNRRLHALMERFRAKTGCPVLINTSFNVRGEPIVCTPEDAYRCFMATDMDALVLEDLLLLKEEQPENPEYDRARHLARFRLD